MFTNITLQWLCLFSKQASVQSLETLRMTKKKSVFLQRLHRGHFLAKYAGSFRSASVRAAELCDLQYIGADRFYSVLRYFPEDIK
mmetsp:Transcript_10749/g.13440  ORF Transcript_10749/g.13440 Transcript_10749/m.13440 type:complete len:85 (+) Transcript_10749:292-546(+)